jgi:N-acyl-D-amino-acid deacylase
LNLWCKLTLPNRPRLVGSWKPALLLQVCVAMCCANEAGIAAEPRYDLVLQSGRIVDGTGAPWYVADVGIRAGKIAAIGRIDAKLASRVIDASGLVVAPGFVDMMGQTATPMLDNPASALNLLTQGITTINCGEGVSAAPLSAEEARTRGWQTMAEYFTLLDLKGLPVNVAQTIGHTQVRQLVLGDVDRRPTPAELDRMRDLVREAMEAGAIGVSTALIYPPAAFAQTEEIAALAEVAGQHGGRYYTHMRNEGDQLLEAIDEALEIGRTGKTPVHIFHLKAAGRHNWGKMQLAIAKIKAARAEGHQVTADIYPYINNGLGMGAFIHPRHFAEGYDKLVRKLDDEKLRAEIRQEMETVGGWENWYRHVGGDWGRVVVGRPNDRRYDELAGQTVAEIAKAKNEDPWDTFFQLVRSDAFVLPQSMAEANVVLALQQEFVSFCTDVGPAGGSSIASHPRAFGALPRLFSRYVRDLGAISLERAVAQASAVAGNEVMAYDRGRIAEGLAADVIVFDYAALTDRATFSQPQELAVGMKYVIVNGAVVLEDGKYTGKRPGRVLRGPGYRSDLQPQHVSTGKTDPRLASFDRLMEQLLQTHQIPGAALAVTDRGRLVHARGYGYADIAARDPVQPTSRFRIASISKPVTAIAILRLIEQQKLNLDDKVGDVLQWQDQAKGVDKFDERQRQITIRQLLEHRGGWDRDVSFDAMFQSVRFAKQLDVAPPAGPTDVMRAMFHQPLDFAPGERYAYSNYGYCLLGRVIEKITGQPYEDYVRSHVLAPAGITAMRLGKSLPDERQPGEVRYYDPGRGPSVFAKNLGETVPWAYGGWYLEAMDAHGAWIASAVDLARFACALDDTQKTPLLTKESLALMQTRPPGLAGHDAQGKPKDVYYGLGWQVRDVGQGRYNHWHTGSLAGTATILIRRNDGRHFAVLFNARSGPSEVHLGRAVDELIHAAAAQAREWPEEDLFPTFQAETSE